MISRLAQICLVGIVLLISSVSSAQIVARQGTIDTEHHFKSPMLLQLPLPNITTLPMGTRRGVAAEIGRFTCDDVSIETLTVEHKAGPRRPDGKLTFEFAGSVRVPDSFDRMVGVSLVVKKGDVTLGGATAAKIDAEEGRATRFHVTVILDEAQSIDAFRSDPPPILEVTVTVRANT